MRVSCSVLIMVLINCTLSIFSEDAKLVTYFDNETIKINYQSFGGLNLSIHGQSSGTTMGITQSINDMLKKYPESKESVEKYTFLNNAGNILLWGGLGAVLGGSYYPILSMDYNISSSTFGNEYMKKFQTGLYFMIGGLVAELIGTFILPLSFQELLNSVNQYNHSIMKEYHE